MIGACARGSGRRLPRVAAAVAMAVALALAATACAGTTADPQLANKHPQAGSAGSADAVTLLDGTTVRVPDGKPAALFFFSVGCGSCIGGARSLHAAEQRVGARADFLAVDVAPSEPASSIRQFLDYVHAPDLPVTVDTHARLIRHYKVAALSTLVVVDPSGKVTYRATDPTATQIRAALTRAGTS